MASSVSMLGIVAGLENRCSSVRLVPALAANTSLRSGRIGPGPRMSAEARPAMGEKRKSMGSHPPVRVGGGFSEGICGRRARLRRGVAEGIGSGHARTDALNESFNHRLRKTQIVRDGLAPDLRAKRPPVGQQVKARLSRRD